MDPSQRLEDGSVPKNYVIYLDSPMGRFAAWGDESRIVNAGFTKAAGEDSPDLPDHMVECRRQMAEYFSGERTEFDLPLGLEGTEFQVDVWEGLRRIPYGQTRGYGQLAKEVGRPGAARAVGGACRSNPLGVIVPCHRVIGASGDLVGFGGQAKELGLKRDLIEHEARRGRARLDGLD
jgi:methylated-DNA-[protein]-cysteine S-methyltransferase